MPNSQSESSLSTSGKSEIDGMKKSISQFDLPTKMELDDGVLISEEEDEELIIEEKVHKKAAVKVQKIQKPKSTRTRTRKAKKVEIEEDDVD